MNLLASKSKQIGDFLVTVLNDGEMNVNLTFLSGIDEKSAAKIQTEAGISNVEQIDINCYLIQGHGQTILIDSGTGGLNDTGGLLLKNLARMGITPNDIDSILITHAHPDHIGGLLNNEGEPIYKNAKIYLHALEIEYWQNDQALEQATERGKRNFSLVRRTLKAYSQKINIFDKNEPIAGISPIFLPGHTPGHTGFKIGKGESSLLIWADIVHFPHIQLPDPTISIVFDYDKEQAKVTRQNLLEKVVKERQLIAGMHTKKSGFAYIYNSDQQNSYKISYLN
ncbi:MBL fold metallo-hydrolase (plasmid) [Acinetobacter sp. ESL0695]|uniref:MBL fold metallo-hydrolase n=1 Tax=Acinetobacter sp. ESL0695 TaxID=2983215 RepID=UPI0023F0B649|nr:MBL fold metallo-hydrolase [Acinetobacter sp. ESL0695]WEV50205.1 MBL fold metallo-hydrolase [Acinetobacter sp. ESL0695]